MTATPIPPAFRQAFAEEELGWPALLAVWLWLPSLVALAVLRGFLGKEWKGAG